SFQYSGRMVATVSAHPGGPYSSYRVDNTSRSPGRPPMRGTIRNGHGREWKGTDELATMHATAWSRSTPWQRSSPQSARHTNRRWAWFKARCTVSSVLTLYETQVRQ